MYDHRSIEKEIEELWSSSNIYQKVKNKNEKGEPFYFCDGPPYATGQIHPGTGWNKCIKDSVCRYWRSKGRNVRAQLGYDTHGLPIEVKVEQELGIKKKNEIEQRVGVDKFIEKCKEFATKYIGIMNNQFRSLGVWMDYNNPYITYKDDYINASWGTLKMAWDKGLMHEGVYVLPYCYRCETTMANYELEYGEESDPSIYIKFKVKGKENEYLIIWTTTPWTLVANLGVMVHPIFHYVKVKIDDEVWYVAKERLDTILTFVEKPAVVLEELSGKKLEGLAYEHPFQKDIGITYERKVILSDEFVTLEDGSGLVHCAPGHGPEDFIIGKRYDIPPLCPVDESGNFTKEGGIFAGKNVKEANPLIIAHLKNLGMLLKEERIKHRYPHCWRCKTPLIFRTTNQWFIVISKMKDRMLEEIDKTEWHPNFAQSRFKEFVSSAPDWCISRQRYWGIPLPIWKCTQCKEIRMIGSREELPKIKELHRPYIDKVELDCRCGAKMKRIGDVLDVWFDSGNAIWAPLSSEDTKLFGERADIIIEGQDQIRGWFYSLLGSGLVRYNQIPYKRLLMHGFFVDEKGEKMSKSVGNFVPLEEILLKYGADSFRLWGLSNTIWEELKFNWTDLKEANGDLNILFNIFIFMQRFYPQKKIETAQLEIEDRWLLSRANNTLREFNDAFRNYEINRAVKAIRYFIVEDMSRWYMKIAKGRVSSGANADGVFFAMYHSMLMATKMFSIVTPFIGEYIYQKFFRDFEQAESIFLLQLEEADENAIDAKMERQMDIVKEMCAAALSARQAAGIKLRWPVRKIFISSKSREVEEAFAAMKHIVVNYCNAKDVVFSEELPADVVSEPFSLGSVSVDKSIDEELYAEAIVNEITRRVQVLRKEATLVEKDSISVLIETEKEFEAIIRNHEEEIKKAVNASTITFGKTEAKEYEVDGRLVKIEIKKN